MKAERVILNVRAALSMYYTELDDDKAPATMDWEQFKYLVEEVGSERVFVEVEVIREAKPETVTP
jgi:hypothetical protein